MTCCVVCDLRGQETVKPADRLRGFEIEISRRMVEQLSSTQTCKEHLRKCDGRCQKKRTRADEPCDCKLCLKEKAASEKPDAVKLVCPGHPCLEQAHESPTFLAKFLTDAGVACHGSFENWRRTPRNNDYWDLKTDSSCGYEIATPPWRGAVTRDMLENGLKGLVQLEAAHKGWLLQDDACGLHVTFDISDQGLRGVKRILLMAVRHQSAMLGTQPKYRWNNRNCQKFGEVWLGTMNSPGLKRRITYIQSAGRLQEVVPEKYFLINTKKFADGEGLLEFRFGGATVDAAKIAAYGVLVECLIQSAIERPAMVDTSDRKKRLYQEIIKPYIADRRVQEAWETVLWPALQDVQLPADVKAPPKVVVRNVMQGRGL